MAFSNTQRIGLGGGLSIVWGDYTHTVGAADQTLAVDGDLIWGGVRPNVTTEPLDYRGDALDTTVSGNITTITVRSEAGVSAGRFILFLRGGS